MPIPEHDADAWTEVGWVDYHINPWVELGTQSRQETVLLHHDVLHHDFHHDFLGDLGGPCLQLASAPSCPRNLFFNFQGDAPQLPSDGIPPNSESSSDAGTRHCVDACTHNSREPDVTPAPRTNIRPCPDRPAVIST